MRAFLECHQYSANKFRMLRRQCDASSGNIVMRILSKRQLKELVLYSPQHIARLEKAGQFPKRVNLGPCRVGWVEDEVLDWLRQRLDRREAPSRHSS
ncbi:helix-turn-helix transcriptional regulator [Erythrobacter aureus]|uniref:helix-turn-helix transcriptional regulator n=2 Tax=Erythrobacter aureus TaxID=2182384 RepID=UPI003A8F34E3